MSDNRRDLVALRRTLARGFAEWQAIYAKLCDRVEVIRNLTLAERHRRERRTPENATSA